MKQNIIIIENQITQYRPIRNAITSSNYGDVYPDNDESWSEFMKYVKVLINKEYGDVYGGHYQAEAQKWFINKLKEIRPTIIVMDFLLGGLNCMNGIELAEMDVENKKFIEVMKCPILFLSREGKPKEYDDFHETHKNSSWMAKSYSQTEEIESKYIKKNMFKIINELTKIQDSKSFRAKLEKLRRTNKIHDCTNIHYAINKIDERYDDDDLIDERIIEIMSPVIDKIKKGEYIDLCEDEYSEIKSIIGKLL